MLWMSYPMPAARRGFQRSIKEGPHVINEIDGLVSNATIVRYHERTFSFRDN